MVGALPYLGRRAMLFGVTSAATAALGCSPSAPRTTTDTACFFDPLSLIGGDQSNCTSAGTKAADIAWHLKMMRVREAWNLSPPDRCKGKGILIGHVDTGVARHREFEAGGILWQRGYDFIDDVREGYDPLVEHLEYLEQIGHGTSTASVIVSRGEIEPWPEAASTCGGTGGPARITGVAPAADLIPVRAFRFAATSRMDRVAEAIRYLTAQEVDVITMALGWPFPNAEVTTAIQKAIANNILVLAASGNVVASVTFPASLDGVIAVGGVGPDTKPWCGGSQGSKVTVSAPADKIWRAYRDEKSHRLDLIGPRFGTSFAVSLTAGVAALWLAHFGRSTLIDRARAEGLPNLQALFRRELTRTAWQPEGWSSYSDGLGAGIVDAEALLQGTRRVA